MSATVRAAAERAAVEARRVEGILDQGRQDTLRSSVEAHAEIVEAMGELCEAVADARDAAGERAALLEASMLGEGTGDDVADELRSCSRAEAELQTRMRATGEAVTEAEVRAAHLRDRRDEADGRAGADRRAAGARARAGHRRRSTDAEREEIERKLERLARRREQLGPVNPLAEREYEEALAHVTELEEQRADLEAALGELAGLIRETDRRIEDAFEETFDAAQKNFGELVEHLFPGGRGRLRLVSETRAEAPSWAAPRPADAGASAASRGRGPTTRARRGAEFRARAWRSR